MKNHFIKIVIISLVFITSCQSSRLLLNRCKIDEVFQTERNEADNIDSPAIWHGTAGQNWIVATAKEGNRLVINDAESGKLIKYFGSEGVDAGKFKRPNGVIVIKDFLFVVERDNKRIQILSLPDFKFFGFFGDSLIKPYGITGYQNGKNSFRFYITDNYETPEGGIPPNEELDRRIHIYDIIVKDSLVDSKFVKAFGNTSGDGVLNIVESVFADTVYNRLLVSEEDTNQSSVKVYDLDGNFSGLVFGKNIFKYQVEGISLYESPQNKGYWIITDQDYENNTFHVFNRNDLSYICSFYGEKTTNTDGICLTQKSFGRFKQGAFYAIHNDGNLSAFDLGAIISSFNGL